MKKTIYIERLYLLLLLLTMVGRGIFLWYNSALESFDRMDTLEVFLHGLPQDLLCVSALCTLPWLVTLFVDQTKMSLRKALGWYLVIAMILGVLLTAGDMVMYKFWKFKLDASIFGYMTSPGEVGACVPLSYVLTRISSALLAIVLCCLGTVFITPKQQKGKGKSTRGQQGNHDWWGMTAIGVVLAATIFFGLKKGDEIAYHGKKIFLSHASVNPIVHFTGSVVLYSKDTQEMFHTMDDKECDAVFKEIYPAETEDIQDTILTTQRPNILTIQLEGQAAPMIEALGGKEGVSPELCAWMQRGWNFTNAWATSFRTDRGTVSALSGYVSYPTVSLMLNTACLDKLSSMPQTLKDNGYDIEYLYGGNPNVMNKKTYLEAMGFKVLGVDDINVSQKERDSWGANDSISLTRLMGIITHKSPDRPWYMGYQTISSHEPWVVPYHRLQDSVYNAFAYSDHCVGRFLEELSQTEAWEDLLVVIYADHGIPYGIDMQNPQFFHMPLIMTGGAVKGIREVKTLISQADIAATILSQMGISHRDFPWSRNIFSRNYTYPCIYSTYPAGILFKDNSGMTMMDVQSGSIIEERGDKGREQRARNAHVMLQKSYAEMPR